MTLSLLWMTHCIGFVVIFWCQSILRVIVPPIFGLKPDFFKLTNKRRINLTYVDPERVNQIIFFGPEICELRKRWHKKMVKKYPKESGNLGYTIMKNWFS